MLSVYRIKTVLYKEGMILGLPPPYTPCILIVEDSKGLLEAYAQLLQWEGFECIVSETASNAWTQFQMNPERVFMVLTDGDLPDRSGRWLAEQIRSCSTIPIILASADPDKQCANAPLLFTDVLRKPFTFFDLLNVIRRNRS